MRRSIREGLTSKALVVLGLSLVVLMLLPVTCAHLQTSTGRYAEALATYNDLMDSYRLQYEISDATTQAEFDQKISPVMGEMSKALSTWKKSKDDATKEEAWSDALYQARAALFKYGIIEEVK